MTSANIAVYVEEVGFSILSNGRGAWLDLPLCEPDEFKEEFKAWLEEEEIEGEVLAMQASSAWAELALQDEVVNVTDIEALNECAWRIENELDARQTEVVRALLEESYDLEEAINAAEAGDVYLLTDVNNEEDYGIYAIDEGFFGNIPEHLQSYIDYEKIGRDVHLEGDIAFTSYGCLCGLNSI